MNPVTPEGVRALVQPGRVHKRLYTDPDIFELELERIFGSAWIYVGHESQVKKSRRLSSHQNWTKAAALGTRRRGQAPVAA